MTDALLFVLVIGAVTVALVADVAVAITWLRSGTAMKHPRQPTRRTSTLAS